MAWSSASSQGYADGFFPGPGRFLFFIIPFDNSLTPKERSFHVPFYIHPSCDGGLRTLQKSVRPEKKILMMLMTNSDIPTTSLAFQREFKVSGVTEDAKVTFKIYNKQLARRGTKMLTCLKKIFWILNDLRSKVPQKSPNPLLGEWNGVAFTRLSRMLHKVQRRTETL